MTVSELAKQLNLRVFSGNEGLNHEITNGYTSDLLSDVMGHAEAGNAWITLQTHKNVMAISSLKDLSAVILVKGFEPEADMLAQSNEEGIPVLGTNDETFVISGKLYNLLKKQ
ncbi:MAG: serine kinase [Bacteroidetes bacterium HGW-Bacteroidetes-9]|nr:MAG: serine kinase [Bacteroidetes bacterium HGW-Bacteroidetes-9]